MKLRLTQSRLSFFFASYAFVSALLIFAAVDISAQQLQTFTYDIPQPPVTNAQTPLQNYTFNQGDQVSIEAGGCVQTGGRGKTWKLYVDPSGPNTDRFYHGLIEIPGVTDGLVRINSVLGRTFTVGPVNPPAYLTLGYEDNDYTDNGYYSHDDGTDNQCLNVGDAYVKIHIARPIVGSAGTGSQSTLSNAGTVQPPAGVGSQSTDGDTNTGKQSGGVSGQSTNSNTDTAKPNGGFIQFMSSTAGLLTAVAALITAVAGLVALRSKS